MWENLWKLFSLAYQKYLTKSGINWDSKIKKNGISGILLNITEDVLANRYQRVVLNGQASGSAGLNNGVSQGSNLVFLFLVYITDLSIYIIKS